MRQIKTFYLKFQMWLTIYIPSFHLSTHTTYLFKFNHIDQNIQHKIQIHLSKIENFKYNKY